MSNWRETHVPARLGEALGNGTVQCHLSPRNCKMKEGRQGFCGVRANRDGRLVSLNYGKSVHATEETIETEAVNHFAPGEPILSMGNIGCMLNCSYCHNWKTSQAKYVDDKDVYLYTPEEVVAIARAHGIRVLSWTYNDPVVWHEFVCDTAKLAREAGMINLYKSALYISPEAIDELLPNIDVFSISLKSMDPDYYRKYTKGTLQPVLDATKQVHRAGKHVEVSTLMLTDISDDEGSARALTQWVLAELDSTVPVHFVRFHPDYRMRDTVRTPIPRLVRAREIALEMGLEHVYLGNVYDTPGSNTYCHSCQAELVSRYGLNSRITGIDERGRCRQCGRDAHFKLLPPSPARGVDAELPPGLTVRSMDWHGDIRSLHAQVLNRNDGHATVYHRRRTAGDGGQGWTALPLRPGESYRWILAKATPDEVGADIALPGGVTSNLHEVFDRAHYPTVSVESGRAKNDVSPLPMYGRNSAGE